MLVDKQSRHRANRHGDIVGHAIISDTLSPMLRRHHVDDQGVAAHRGKAESETMHNTDDNQNGDGGGEQIAHKHCGKDGQRQQIQRLTLKGVHHIA